MDTDSNQPWRLGRQTIWKIILPILSFFQKSLHPFDFHRGLKLAHLGQDGFGGGADEDEVAVLGSDETFGGDVVEEL